MFGYFVDFNETPESLSRYSSKEEMIEDLCRRYHVHDKWEMSTRQLRRSLGVNSGYNIDREYVRLLLKKAGITSSGRLGFNIPDNWYVNKPEIPKIPKKITKAVVDEVRDYLVDLYHFYTIRSVVIHDVTNKMQLTSRAYEDDEPIPKPIKKKQEPEKLKEPEQAQKDTGVLTRMINFLMPPPAATTLTSSSAATTILTSSAAATTLTSSAAATTLTSSAAATTLTSSAATTLTSSAATSSASSPSTYKSVEALERHNRIITIKKKHRDDMRRERDTKNSGILSIENTPSGVTPSEVVPSGVTPSKVVPSGVTPETQQKDKYFMDKICINNENYHYKIKTDLAYFYMFAGVLDDIEEKSVKSINILKFYYLFNLINRKVSYENPKIQYHRNFTKSTIVNYFRSFTHNYSYYKKQPTYVGGDYISKQLAKLNSEFDLFLNEKDNVIAETEYIYLFSNTLDLDYVLNDENFEFTRDILDTNIVESSDTYSYEDFRELYDLINYTDINLIPIYYIYWVVVDNEDTNHNEIIQVYKSLQQRYERITDFDNYRRINAVYYNETTETYYATARIDDDDEKIIADISDAKKLHTNLSNSRIYEYHYNYIDEILPKSILKVGIDLKCYEQLKKNKLFNNYFLLQNIVNLSARDYKELDFNRVYYYDNINFRYTKFDNLIRAILYVQVSNNLDNFKDVFSVNELIDCKYYIIMFKDDIHNEILYMCNRYKKSDYEYNDPDNDYLLKIFTNIPKKTDTTDITIPDFINNILQYYRQYTESGIVNKRIGHLYINTNLRNSEKLIEVFAKEFTSNIYDYYDVKNLESYKQVDTFSDLLNSDFKNIIIDTPINNVYIKFKFIDNSLHDEYVEDNITNFKVFKKWYIEHINTHINTDNEYIKKVDEYISQDILNYIGGNYGVDLVTFLHDLIIYTNNENVLELFNGIDHPENYTIYFPITSIVELIKYELFNKHFMFLKIQTITDNDNKIIPLPIYNIPPVIDNETIKKITEYTNLLDFTKEYIIFILILNDNEEGLKRKKFDILSNIIGLDRVKDYAVIDNNGIYINGIKDIGTSKTAFNNNRTFLVGFRDGIINLNNRYKGYKLDILYSIGAKIDNVSNLVDNVHTDGLTDEYYINYDYNKYNLNNHKYFEINVDKLTIISFIPKDNNLQQRDNTYVTRDDMLDLLPNSNILNNSPSNAVPDTQQPKPKSNAWNDDTLSQVILDTSNDSLNNGYINNILQHQNDRFDEIDRILDAYKFVNVIIAGHNGDNLLVETYAKKDWDDIDNSNNITTGSSYAKIKENLDRLVHELEQKYRDRVKVGTIGFGKIKFIDNKNNSFIKDNRKDPSIKLLHIWGADINNSNNSLQSVIDNSQQAIDFNIKKKQIGVFGIVITPIKNYNAFKNLDIFSNYSAMYNGAYTKYNRSFTNNNIIKDKVNTFNDAMIEIAKISNNQQTFVYYHIQGEKNDDYYTNILRYLITNNNLTMVTWKVINGKNRLNFNNNILSVGNKTYDDNKYVTTLHYKNINNIKIIIIQKWNDTKINLDEILKTYSILIIKTVFEDNLIINMDINTFFYIHGKYSIYVKSDIIVKHTIINIINQNDGSDTIIHLVLNDTIQNNNKKIHKGGGVVPKKSITNHCNELNAIIGKTPVDAISFLIKKYKIPDDYRTNMNKLRSRLLTLNVKTKSGIRELLEGINTPELLKMIPGKLIVLEKHNNPRCKCNMCTPIRESQLENFAKIAQPIMEKNAKYYENVTRLYEKLLSELRYAKRV